MCSLKLWYFLRKGELVWRNVFIKTVTQFSTAGDRTVWEKRFFDNWNCKPFSFTHWITDQWRKDWIDALREGWVGDRLMCNLRMVGGRMTGRRTLNRVGLVFALIRSFSSLFVLLSAWGRVKLRIYITRVFRSCWNCPSRAGTRAISATSWNTSDNNP